VIELLANHTRSEGKELRGDLIPTGAWVEADPEQLKQVLLNLAMNGLDAVERGGWVRIATRALDGVAEIAVRDNGDGIPEELRDRIFEPFFSTKPPEKGTGLGLALCHDLVRENGGEIELRESAVGVGSEFVIRLTLSPRSEVRVHA
jgi:signal transduction histidine kinase